MSARDPTLLSLGCRKVVCRYPGSPFVCLPGLRFALPSRSGRGCPQGALSLGAAPLLFLSADAPGGGARSARSPSPGHTRWQGGATPSGPGCRPPQCAPDLRAPRPSAGGGRGQSHLSTCGGPYASLASVAPGGQDVGGGSRAPPREPRGRCQGEDAGSLCACSPGKQNQAPGAKDELTHHGGAD